MKCSIETPHGRIYYSLKRKSVKNIRIRVTGASQVIVSAPHQSSAERIAQFVGSNDKFIMAKLRDFDNKRALYYPVRFQHGETFWHLGKKTLLHICPADETRAHLEDSVLTLYVPKDSDYRYKKALFILWATRTAKSVFAMRLQHVGTVFPHINVNNIRISVRNMLGRWGSINTKRHTLSLSVHLLRCDPHLIDYIITHELCHYAHANHGKAFYQELERHCPNRKLLDKHLVQFGLVDF